MPPIKKKAVKKKGARKGEAMAGRIRKEMLAILRKNPDGLRLKDLVQRIEAELPEANQNLIRVTIWLFAQKEAEAQDKGRKPKFYQPEQGIYRISDREEADVGEGVARESDLYEQFASYMVEELNECNNAIGLGGRGFGDKWGTPDAIGVMRRLPGNVVDFQTEIVSAEIKANNNKLVEGFGQACAYRLFSHKVYLVAPGNVDPSDLQRLEALCMTSGIGLVLFARGKGKVTFTVRVRAARGAPSMFYANKYLRNVADDLLGF